MRTVLYGLYLRFGLPIRTKIRHIRRIRKIQKKGCANLVFLVSSLPMWRMQFLLDLLLKDPRFHVSIILYPFCSFETEQKESSILQLRSYFDSIGQEYIDASERDDPADSLRGLNPDIIFYPQPYEALYCNGLEYNNYENQLLCYIPYAYLSVNEAWSYNLRFHNIAWRLYYANETEYRYALSAAQNKAKNVRITGATISDYFYAAKQKQKGDDSRKLIIWAPHFSINEGALLHRASFVTIYDKMLQLADKYQDKFIFVLKPHPRLISELYRHKDWGRERTDHYLKEWAGKPNTRMEFGGYIDLFQQSDALIHDCGSFTIEYHFTKNPALFISEDIKSTRDQLNELGQAALDTHYIGKDIDDIEKFLEDVILHGNDPMQPKREAFFNQYLLPPNGKSAAENIYDDLLKSLKFN